MSRQPEAVTSATLAAHMHLVHRVVAQFTRRVPRSVQRDDLVAAGMLGLFNALRTGQLQAENDDMFIAYARIRIRGAILDELRRHDWSPRRRRTPIVTRPLTNDEANDEAPLSGVQTTTARASIAPPAGARVANDSLPPPAMDARAPVHVIGFDDLSPDALGTVLFDQSSGESDSLSSSYGTRSPLTELFERSNASTVRSCMEQLPEREREILRLRYFEEVPAKDIAEAFGLSNARISQLHARATARLKEMLENQGVNLDRAA